MALGRKVYEFAHAFDQKLRMSTNHQPYRAETKLQAVECIRTGELRVNLVDIDLYDSYIDLYDTYIGESTLYGWLKECNRMSPCVADVNENVGLA